MVGELLFIWLLTFACEWGTSTGTTVCSGHYLFIIFLFKRFSQWAEIKSCDLGDFNRALGLWMHACVPMSLLGSFVTGSGSSDHMLASSQEEDLLLHGSSSPVPSCLAGGEMLEAQKAAFSSFLFRFWYHNYHHSMWMPSKSALSKVTDICHKVACMEWLCSLLSPVTAHGKYLAQNGYLSRVLGPWICLSKRALIEVWAWKFTSGLELPPSLWVLGSVGVFHL